MTADIHIVLTMVGLALFVSTPLTLGFDRVSKERAVFGAAVWLAGDAAVVVSSVDLPEFFSSVSSEFGTTAATLTTAYLLASVTTMNVLAVLAFREIWKDFGSRSKVSLFEGFTFGGKKSGVCVKVFHFEPSKRRAPLDFLRGDDES